MTKRQRIESLERRLDDLVRHSNTEHYAAASAIQDLTKRVEELELRFGYVSGEYRQ